MPDEQFIFGAFPMPEELKEHLERQSMQREADVHELDRFFEELTPSQLIIIRKFFRSFTKDKKGRSSAFWDGVVSNMLKSRGICPHCGEVHDTIEELLEDSTEPTETVTSRSGEIVEDFDVTDIDENISKILRKRLVGFPEDVPPQERDYGYSKKELANMKLYRIEDVRDEETGYLQGYACTDCGLPYASIEDRMLKPPAECHGCFRKAAHG